MPKVHNDSAEIKKIQRKLESLLYEFALLCHNATQKSDCRPEHAGLFRGLSDAHASVQRAKSDGLRSETELKPLRRARRNESLVLIRALRRGRKLYQLPPAIDRCVARYAELSQRLAALLQASPGRIQIPDTKVSQTETPSQGTEVRSDLDDETDLNASNQNQELEADEDDPKEVNISGLDLVPDIGDPLKFMGLPPPPPTFATWVRTKLDNADLWIDQNKTLLTRTVRVIVVLLIGLNLLVFHWYLVSTFGLDKSPEHVVASSVEPSEAEDLAAPTAGFARSTALFLQLLVPILVVIGSIIAAFVFWDDKAKRYAESFNLEKVKATLIPFDPVNSPVVAFWESYWTGPAPSADQVRSRDRRLEITQFVATATLLLLLVFPFAQSSALAMTTESGEEVRPSDERNAIHEEFLPERHARIDEVPESGGADGPDHVQASYLWMTGILVLLAILAVLVMWLRQVGHIGRDAAAHFGLGTGGASWADDGPTLVNLKSRMHEKLFSPDEPEIDHEDPYGALVRSVPGYRSAELIAKSFRTTLMIARYRAFNRWRILSVVTYVFQHSFRFIAVVAFVGMFLISIVMPLVFLSSVKDQARSDYTAFRILADPFLEEESDVPLDHTENRLSVDEDGAVDQGRLAVEIETNGEAAIASQQRSRFTFYYVIAILAAVALNIGVTLLRIRHRASHGDVVPLQRERGGLRAKAAFAALLMLLAFLSWGDNMSPMPESYRGALKHPDDARVAQTIQAARVKALSQRKLVTAYLSPPAPLDAVWYVDQRYGSDTFNGRSWSNPFRSLQPAIDACAEAGGGEVWVAEGVYRWGTLPHERTGRGGHRALHVPANVRMFGGFSGQSARVPEADRHERNWEGHPAILVQSTSSVPQDQRLPIVLEDGSTVDGFVIVSTSNAFQVGVHFIGSRFQPSSRATIGNSTLVYENRHAPPLYRLGGSALVYGSTLGPIGIDDVVNTRVTIQPNLTIVPNPIVSEAS